MPKLTDEEVGRLLRETFAEKEDLVDQLPEATVAPVRRKAPVLLAAAAVFVVMAGALSIAGINRGPSSEPASAPPASNADSTPTPPNPQVQLTAPPPSVSTAYLSGVAIAELTKWERPAGGWPVVKVLDASYDAASSPTSAGGAGTLISKQDRSTIAELAGTPISWVRSRPAGPNACDQADGTPYVTLGPVVLKPDGSSATIGMSMWRGCLDARWLTYRLVRATTQTQVYSHNLGGWRVAGTVGPVSVS
jgi:hypothetical protein